MLKTFGPVTRMGPNIWNAVRMQSEFLEYTSNIQECTTNFHSDGIRTHSASSVTGVLSWTERNFENDSLRNGKNVESAWHLKWWCSGTKLLCHLWKWYAPERKFIGLKIGVSPAAHTWYALHTKCPPPPHRLSNYFKLCIYQCWNYIFLQVVVSHILQNIAGVLQINWSM